MNDCDKPKILLVDDHLENIQLAMNMMKDEGYGMSFAKSGEEALEMMKANGYDLILLDVVMPGIDGYETCRRLKADPHASKIPVIFVTIRDSEEELLKGFELGAVDYVTKPFRSAELLARVRAHLTIRCQQKTMEELVARFREQQEITVDQAKYAAIGDLLNNMAHQWRQPLTAVNLTLEGVLDDYRMGEVDEERVKGELGKTIRTVYELSQTITTMGTFISPDREKEPFSVRKEVESTLEVFRIGDPNTVDLRLEVEKDAYITGYRKMFQKVLFSVLQNAREATDRAQVEAPEILVRILPWERGAKIVVEDNGGGIDPDALSRIFEPYYTSKFQSQGIGLSLYMSKIVMERQLNGSIEAENGERGARFTLELGRE